MTDWLEHVASQVVLLFSVFVSKCYLTTLELDLAKSDRLIAVLTAQPNFPIPEAPFGHWSVTHGTLYIHKILCNVRPQLCTFTPPPGMKKASHGLVKRVGWAYPGFCVNMGALEGLQIECPKCCDFFFFWVCWVFVCMKHLFKLLYASQTNFVSHERQWP